MEQVNKIKIETGFGTDRKVVKARCWNGVGLSTWKEMQVGQLEDESKWDTGTTTLYFKCSKTEKKF